ncbi:MAG: hypothetical protein IJM25_10255 [Eubacterium sp.]|nr:hypothetical protein [Eubacterium sp.]
MKERLGTRTAIKYIAILAMLIDHIGMLFLPITTIPGLLCRVIGRLTAPVMCFFLAEGYVHTSSRKKYGTRLLIFGLISQIPYALAHYGVPSTDPVLSDTVAGTPGFSWERTWMAILKPDFNMIITLFLCFLILYVYDLVPGYNRRVILIGLLLAASMLCDWGLVAPLYVLAFAVCREDRKKQLQYFSLITAGYVVMQTVFCIMNDQHWYGQLWQLGLFLFIPIRFLYNGESGSRAAFHKWFFYIFYPVHFLIFWAILTWG